MWWQEWWADVADGITERMALLSLAQPAAADASERGLHTGHVYLAYSCHHHIPYMTDVVSQDCCCVVVNEVTKHTGGIGLMLTQTGPHTV